MSIKVLVTGANGQLAKTIAELFTKNENAIDFTFVSKSKLDITNKESVRALFNKDNYAYCVNCAAYTNVEQAEQTPEIAFKVNAEGVKYIAEACRDSNMILVQISTDYVFDGKKRTPYTIDDIPNPINEYGKSKHLGERYIQETLKDFFIIRTSWLYSLYGHNFLKTIIGKITENENLKITTSQTGTPTSCIELSKFIYFLIKSEQNNYGVYHFSATGKATWYDFAREISKYFKDYNVSKISPLKTLISKTKRPTYSVLDIKRTQLLERSLKNWETALNDTMCAS